MRSKLLRIILGLVLLLVILVVIAALLLWQGSQHPGDRADLRLLQEVIDIVKKQYVEEVDDKRLMESAIKGMLASLDPHSAFMPADSFKEMKVQMSGSFGGIGIELGIKDNKLTVIAPIEDTPAYRAGIKANDHIWKIDDKFTKDMSITEAVGRMRGEKGTKVTLTILREGNGPPLVFPLMRAIIKTKSLKSRTLESGLGYIRIGHFQETTGQEFTKALKTLHALNGGTLKGLVIDLRNNPGGLLNQAVEVANHFIGEGFSNGLVVYTEGRDPSARMKLSTNIGDKEPRYPIVVLVNGGSASASEILAGAMQDHKRAIIMGTQTFGKGSVQSVLSLRDNAGLKLTTARYYTPSGRSIQAKGITPDIIVDRVTLPEQPAKNPSEHIKEQDLERRLQPEPPPSPTLPATGKEPHPAKPATPAINGEGKGDYQLARAIELLRGLTLIGTLNTSVR